MQTYPRVFYLNYRIASYVGVWETESSSVTVRAWHAVYRNVAYVMAAVMLYQVAGLVWVEDREDLVMSLLLVVFMLLSLSKGVALLWKKDKVQALQEELSCYLHLPHVGCAQDVELVESKARVLMKATKATHVYNAVCFLAVFGGVPLLVDLKPWWLPIPLTLPYDHKQDWIYPLTYLLELIVTFYISTLLSTTTLLFSSFVLQISAQYEILARNLEQSSDLAAVKRSVQHHHVICRQVKLLDDINRESLFLVFLCLTLCLSVCGYHITTVPASNHSLTIVSAVLSILTVLFVHCVLATELELKSQAVVRAAYNSPWKKQSPSFRRHIATILLGAQHPPKLTMGGHFPVTTNLFFAVMKTTYNMLALLRQLSNKQSS